MKDGIKIILKKLKIEDELLYFYRKQNEVYKTLFFNSIEKRRVKLEKTFKTKLGYQMNWENPETYNQKIQIRKVFDKNPLLSVCADKIKVRKYVENKIGEKYLIPTIDILYRKLTMEDLKKYPNKFVVKANHNSGPVQVISDKNNCNLEKIVKEINSQLKCDYGIVSGESWYSNIKRGIIVEEFLETKKNYIDDYRFHCFKNNGDIKIIIQVDTPDISGNHDLEIRSFHNENWDLLPFQINPNENDRTNIKKPKHLKKMLEIAKKLSEDFEYVRVDLYNHKSKILFGELTFAHNSGFSKISPLEWDERLGSYWNQVIKK